MLKVGDTVECIDPYRETLKRGSHYIIERIEINTNIRLKGISGFCWLQSRFRFIRSAGESTEEKLEKKIDMNPAIEEYTKTVTVRKLRPSTILPFSDGHVSILTAGNRVSLTLKSIVRKCWAVRFNANELRTLAKQLIEIADVLDEQKD